MLRRVTDEDEKEPPALVRAGNRALRVVEDGIYIGVAVLLSIAAVVVLVQAAVQLIEGIGDGDTASALLDVLDSLLLVFIFVELLFAVRATLSERQVVVEPFLLVGILAAIKEIVVLSVTAAEEYIDMGPQFARAMVEVGLLGSLVLLLSAAAVLLRRKEREPEENADAGTQGAAPAPSRADSG